VKVLPSSRWLCVIAVALAACRPRPDTDQEPSAASATPLASAPVSPSASVAADTSASALASAPAPVPTMVVVGAARDGRPLPLLFAETFLPAVKDRPYTLSAVDNAVVVQQEQRVGRLHDGKVEWLPQKIPTIKGIDKQKGLAIHGHWPEALDVALSSGDGGDLAFAPLTGEGTTLVRRTKLHSLFLYSHPHPFFVGVGQVGATSLVVSHDPGGEGTLFHTFRGPTLFFQPTSRDDEHCLAMVNAEDSSTFRTAISPGAFGSTRAGTAMLVGNHCDNRQIGAEVWDRSGKSRIVYFPWKNPFGHALRLLPGAGDDELWIVTRDGDQLVHYKDGEFSPFDLPPGSLYPMLSPDRQLVVSVAQVAHRKEGDEWQPLARFFWPLDRENHAFDGKGFWGLVDGAIVRYREGPALDFHPGCPTPFVYTDFMDRSQWDSYYSRRVKGAMTAARHPLDLKPVEFRESGVEHFGFVGRNEEQARALLAHLEKLSHRTPRLLCYAPRPFEKLP
jgi:hypothetical protein